MYLERYSVAARNFSSHDPPRIICRSPPERKPSTSYAIYCMVSRLLLVFHNMALPPLGRRGRPNFLVGHTYSTSSTLDTEQQYSRGFGVCDCA